MNKKLTAKTQKLIPILGENEAVFSSSIAIEPPERELVLKKGSVYTVFDVSSPVPLNVPLISKVINDVLYDSYYHSENISPIQSLEKAIVDINDKVANLTAQAVSTQSPGTKKEGAAEAGFNIVAGVLWGNVLYMVQYGKGKSFLMRDGEIKEVSSTSEGNFSVASGVVKNGDVIILNTEKFAQKYPPEKLLDASLSSNDLEPGFSSIILKFTVDEEFSEDEVIDFGVKADKKPRKLKSVFQGGSSKPKKKQKAQSIQSLIDAPATQTTTQPASQNMVQPTTPAAPAIPTAPPIMQTTPPTEPEPKAPKIKPKTQLASKKERQKEQPNIKLRSKRGGKKFSTKTLTIAASMLLTFSVVLTLLIRNNRPNSDQQVQGQNKSGSSLFFPKEFNKKEETETPVEEQQTPEVIEETQPDQDADAINKIARVDSQPFYDIKLADENANPSEIIAFTNSLVVTDANSGKVFVSDISTPKFVAEEQAFAGITSAINYSDKLNFADSESYKIYNLGTSLVEDTYEIRTTLASRYLGNVYSIEGSEIIKYVTSGDEITSSVWGEDASLANAKNITVSYSIYVVSNQDDLLVFTQGEKTDFSITGLDVPLNKVSGITADVNFDYIYLADSGNSRVVVLDTDGSFVKQLKADEDGTWSNIQSVSVNADETRMYLLNGSKVFEIDLTNANPPAIVGPELPETDVTTDTIEVDETTDTVDEVVETDGTAE